jgi:hypothetical protein
VARREILETLQAVASFRRVAKIATPAMGDRRFESTSLQRRVSELRSLSTSAGRTPPNRTRCSSSSISASRTTDERARSGSASGFSRPTAASPSGSQSRSAG